VVLVVVVEVVVVLVEDPGAAHSPAAHTPLQHWPFVLQGMWFGLQESAAAWRASTPPIAKTMNAMTVTRFTECPTSRRTLIGPSTLHR
jgi:hypothetical protein